MLRMVRRMTRLIPVAISLACGLLAASAFAESPFKFEDTPGKLPKDVVPTAYRLALVPDLEALRFTGQEQIDIEVATATDTVTLDARNLSFDHVALLGEDSAKAKVMLDKAAETASFQFPHPLPAGKHPPDIAYAGPIPAEPHGLYYNDFDTPAGRKR